MKDCLENEINVGDRIVYPNRHGGNMWLCSGTVKSIGASSIKVTKNNGRAVTVSALKRVAVVKPVGEIHVVEGKFEAATAQSLAQAAPATKYPLSALGVAIKPGDRGIVMKWGWDIDRYMKPYDDRIIHCNKPVVVVSVNAEHGLGVEDGYIDQGGIMIEGYGSHMPASQFVHIGTKFDGNLTELTRHNKLAWITALRSGEFKQCSAYLNRDGKYCCLGVACEVGGLRQRSVTLDNFPSYKEFFMGNSWHNGALLPGVFGLTEYGRIKELTDLDGRTQELTDLNDRAGLTFDQIADIIEYFL